MATEWKNLPNTSTPITAGNLIKDQTAVQVTQPTGGQGVWIKDSKNLFDYTKVQPNKSISSSDGTISTNTGYAFCGYIPVKPDTTYTRSAIGTGGNTFLGANFNYISSAQGTTFTTPANCYYVGFNTTMTNYNNDTYKTFMVNEGSTLLTYEPYIKNPTINELKGGVYKEIYNKDNMGDLVVDSVTGKNLFDKDNNINYYNWLIYQNGEIGYSNISPIRLIQIPIVGGRTYTISKVAGTRFRASTSDKDVSQFSKITNNGVNSHVTNDTGATITITSTTSDKYLYFTIADSETDYNTMKQSTMVEEGSTAADYVPYMKYGYNSEESMGNIVVDDVTCKNILNLVNKSGTVNGITYVWEGTKLKLNGTATVNTNIYNIGSWGSTIPYFQMKAGSYTSSITGASNINRFAVYILGGNDGTLYLLSHSNTTQKITTILSNDYNACSYYISIPSGATFNNETFYLQLERGSQATSYTPYKSFDATAYVLWTNPNPTSAFATQLVTLNDVITNYKYYEVIYKRSKDIQRYKSTGRVPTTYGVYMNENIPINRIRTINEVLTNSVRFSDCLSYPTYGQDTTNTTNDYLIPYQVIAYK